MVDAPGIAPSHKTTHSHPVQLISYPIIKQQIQRSLCCSFKFLPSRARDWERPVDNSSNAAITHHHHPKLQSSEKSSSYYKVLLMCVFHCLINPNHFCISFPFADEQNILLCKKEELQCGNGLCLLNWLRCHYKKDCGKDYMSIKITCSSEWPSSTSFQQWVVY